VLDDLDIVTAIVRDGRNNMPPFGAALTAAQIRDVSAYLIDAFAVEL